MRKLFISLIFLLYFTILPNVSNASQVIGGEITYSCTGNPDEYLVELRVYRDCDGPGSVLESISYSSARCGMNESLNLILVNTANLPQNCPALMNVEERLYSGILNLTMDCGNDWVLSYSTCCRNSAITSGAANEGFHLSAFLDNTLAECNNSPVFSSPGQIFICDNEPVSYSLGAIDPEGDDLVFSLANCSQNPNIFVSYNVGLSGVQPLSTTSGFSIDPATSEINFTPTPGVFQVGSSLY
jgi:hypothetical protein